MAAIDKLYVNEYYEYDTLVRWSIIYYPKLLNYFYDTHISPKEWEVWKKNILKNKLRIRRREIKKIPGKDITERINSLISYYKESADYNCSLDQAREEVLYILKQYIKTKEQLYDEIEIPILNTPISIDNKLKWFCPIPFVRKYLHEKCGVNPKLEWFYKIFWKGKKYF